MGQHHFLKPWEGNVPSLCSHREHPVIPYSASIPLARVGCLTSQMLGRGLEPEARRPLPALCTQLSEEQAQAPCSACVLLSTGALRGVHPGWGAGVTSHAEEDTVSGCSGCHC